MGRPQCMQYEVVNLRCIMEYAFAYSFVESSTHLGIRVPGTLSTGYIIAHTNISQESRKKRRCGSSGNRGKSAAAAQQQQGQPQQNKQQQKQHNHRHSSSRSSRRREKHKEGISSTYTSTYTSYVWRNSIYFDYKKCTFDLRHGVVITQHTPNRATRTRCHNKDIYHRLLLFSHQ